MDRSSYVGEPELCQLSATGALQRGVVAGREAEPLNLEELGRILTRQQVARWLQVQPRQLDGLGVPCIDLGHKTKRYCATDVKVWLEAQRRASRRTTLTRMWS